MVTVFMVTRYEVSNDRLFLDHLEWQLREEEKEGEEVRLLNHLASLHLTSGLSESELLRWVTGIEKG